MRACRWFTAGGERLFVLVQLERQKFWRLNKWRAQFLTGLRLAACAQNNDASSFNSRRSGDSEI
jgi:hypothetical protein